MPPHLSHYANVSLVPLVNRAQEMSLLKEAVNAAIENQGKLVVLCGEAGIGKTRLATELCPFARSRGIQMLYGKAPASFLAGGRSPYSLWRDVIRDYLQDRSSDQLNKVVGYYPSEICKLVPEIKQKLAVFPESPSLDPEMERDRLFEAVTQFITNISRTAPLIVVLDDLQWADKSSLQLLSYVTRGVYRESLLVLGAYRDSEIEDGDLLSSVLVDLNRARLLQTVKLKRLSCDEATQLVTQIIGQVNVPKEFCELVFEKTAGNPFFVEEVVSSLREEGVIVPEKDLYAIKVLSEIEFPKSVKDVLKARISRVDEESQKVLNLASVVGNSFPFEALRKVAGIEENRLLELVENLEKIGLLKCQVIRGEDVIAFADVLVRDVLYEEISPLKRKRLHDLVGKALEKAYSGTLEEHMGELAVHFLESGDDEKALDYHLRAGEAAKKVYANIEAASHFRSAYELLKMNGEDPVKLINILETLADLEELTGDYDACLQHRNQELMLLEKMGEKHKIAKLYRKMSFVHWMRKGNVNEAKEYQDKALQILQSEHESPDLASLKLDIADMLWHTGDQNKAYDVVEEALEISERLNDAETITHAYQFKGKLLSFRGESESALKCLKRALKLATDHGNLLMEIECYSTLGAGTSRTTEHESTIGYFQKGYELARKVGALSSQSWVASHMAINLAMQGNTDSALLLAEEAVALDRKSSNLHNIPFSLVALGDTCRTKGEYVKAEQLLTEALQVAQKSKIVPTTVFAAANLANLYYDMGRYTEAKEVSMKEFEMAKRGLAGTNQALFSFSRVYVWSCIELGEFEEAQKFIDEWWKNAQVSGDTVAKAILCDITAMLQRAQGKWSEAIEHFEQRIHEYEAGTFRVGPRVTIHYYARRILFECALAYIGRNMEGDKKKALVLLNQALDIFQRVGSRERANLTKAKIAFIDTGREQIEPPSPIKIGYEPLDRLAQGGIPQTFAVAVTSPSCDEKDLLVKSFLETGAKSGQPTFYATLNPTLAGSLAQDFPSTFFLFDCSPQSCTAKSAPNLFPLKGVGNLTNISIALTSTARKLDKSAEKSAKRLCIDIVSDVLLQHGPVTARKWLAELLTQLRKIGFTTIAVMDPRMHPSDQLYAILSMFDGEVNIREAETEKGVARFLKVKRMSNAKFLGEEIRLS